MCGQVCSSQAGVIGCSWHCCRVVVLWFCVCGILQLCPCLCKGVWHTLHTSTLSFTTVYPTVCHVQPSLNLYVILELMRTSPWKWYCVYVEGKEMDHTALWENNTREKTHISHTILLAAKKTLSFVTFVMLSIECLSLCWQIILFTLSLASAVSLPLVPCLWLIGQLLNQNMVSVSL